MSSVTADSMQWLYTIKDQTQGPVTESDLARLLIEGKINGRTLVWKEGMEHWLPLQDTELLSVFLDTSDPSLQETCDHADPEPEPILAPAAFAEDIKPSNSKPHRESKPSDSCQPDVLPPDSSDIAETVHSWTSGANWFYLIAFLTIVNILLLFIDMHEIYALGLISSVYLIYDLGYTYNNTTNTYMTSDHYMHIAIGISIFSCVIMTLIGWISKRGNPTIYVIGLIIFLIDTMLLLLPGRLSVINLVIGISVHGCALWQLLLGLTSLLKLRQLGYFDAVQEEEA
ncbi:MAG: DUF4339 domain-containing protein [Verrucomicrobiota bacterium]